MIRVRGRGPQVRVIAATAAATGVVLTGAACGQNTGPAEPGKLNVVASTDVWGAVAKAVAGDAAGVRSIYSSPDGDPHEFEATARDSATISGADVIVENGADYDAYMEKAQKNPDSPVIDAFDVYKKDDPGAPTGEGEVNEHFFYNLRVVRDVASDLADAMAEKDPPNRQTYRDNADAFATKIEALETELARIKAAHNGQKVAQTEPLAAYLLSEAGLVDATPTSFTDAVEAGNDPPASAVATTEGLIDKREVRALLYNTQATDPTTQRLLERSKSVGLPVVELTETLPEGVTDYVAWQTKQIDAISSAVSR
ncbi:zinc ABC transporter substrate-binding protein [uncultured Williamsia sp.]|uniref:metal ABC transporter solute-binding protein, Zn/Mn family n=1 Tax=uncultured Williamsia sp. TaxID=259311 RepID=UPI00261B5D25|nr:zinc ABC transporter substrate-binding protein [uncultured Williamsia sp.]